MQFRGIVGLLAVATLGGTTLADGTPVPEHCAVYVVDSVNDTLMTLDVETGVAQLIGPLGVDMDDADLTVCNGTLYMLDESVGIRIFALDHRTGAVLEEIPVTWAGGTAEFAEGLTCLDGELVIGFSVDALSVDPFSEGLGVVEPDGQILTWADLTAMDADFDALGASDSQIIGADYVSGNPLAANIFEATQDPPEYSLLNTVAADLNDLMVSGKVLLGIDEQGQWLHVIDLATGVLLESIQVTGADGYHGIAPVIDSACCPSDLDNDGLIGIGDILMLLSNWGPCPGCPADLDGSGAVDTLDLLSLLAAWGPCP